MSAMMTSLSTKLVNGYQRIVTVDEITKIYRDIVSISIPKAGKIQRIGDNVYSLTNQFRTVDCDTLESINTFKVYSLTTKSIQDSDNCIDSVRCVSDPHAVGEIASATSANGRYIARLASRDTKLDGTKRQLLEIWDRSKLVKTIDTSELDIHGTINVDLVFSSFVWSPFGENDKLLYVCQAAAPKHLSFFKDTLKLGKEYKIDDDVQNPLNLGRGEKYIRRRDWGECLDGIEHTKVGILDVANNCDITTIELEGHSLANPQWLDGGKKVVSVAYKENPRLGLIYCNNKESKIVIHEWRNEKQLPIQLVSDKESLYGPRVNHKGDKFVYLSNPSYGAHFHSVKLNIYDLGDNTHKSLDVEKVSKKELFIQDLPANCFSTDDKHILFVDQDNLSKQMCLFSLETSKFAKIGYPTSDVSVLDFRYDIVLACGSEVNATPTLFVAVLNSNDIDDVVGWHQIEDCTHLDEIKHETFNIPTLDGTSFVSGILVEPDLESSAYDNLNLPNKAQVSEQFPTVVLVHGGPHSSFIQSYTPNLIFNARLGFKTLIINYRGSSGVSEDYLESLCGKISQFDVEDCLTAIKFSIQKRRINPSRLVVAGGSHGGFIAAHLSCNDDVKFTSAILRNPVIDLSSLRATSDIPEWTYIEALALKHYDACYTPSSSEMVKLYECSPMYQVSKANVPTLMMLGKNDRRVNMYQGERWVDNLQARGIETMCKMYDDKHSLDKAETAADVAITTAIWMLDHLPKS